MSFEPDFGSCILNALTAREAAVSFRENISLVEGILQTFQSRASGRARKEMVNAKLVMTRLVSEGYLDVDIKNGLFRLCRPTLLSLSGVSDLHGAWALVGARSERVRSLLRDRAGEHRAVFRTAFGLPRPVYLFGRDPTYSELTDAGVDVIGTPYVSASDVYAGALSAVEYLHPVPADRFGYYYALSGFRISSDDFTIVGEQAVSAMADGFYVLTNRTQGRPITIFCRIRSGAIYVFSDWRWFYCEYQSARGAQAVDAFYNPARQEFGAFAQWSPDPRLLGASRRREENWIPWEVARALGASAGPKTVVLRHVQDYTGRYKEAYLYPNVSPAVALACYAAMGLNKAHQLRLLHY